MPVPLSSAGARIGSYFRRPMFVIAKATSAAFESLKLHKTDLRYLTVISAIAAIPVVVLRCLPLSCAVCRQACLWLPLAGELVVLWMWRRAWLANEIQATQELQAEVPRGAWAAARPALSRRLFRWFGDREFLSAAPPAVLGWWR